MLAKPSNTEIQQSKIKPLRVGVMDSGVGGLSVLKHCLNRMPQANYLYMADSQYAPYGGQTAEQIRNRCLHIAQQLIAQEVDAIVVACNTATAAAIDLLRARLDLPIIGMEPAVKPAVLATRNQKIGVLATTGTLQSAQFAALLENYGKSVTVSTQACVGLVECVEKGALDTPQTMTLLKRYCEPLIQAQVDTIVLGCTHYPFLKSLIQQIVGDQVELIETGLAVAKQLQRQLEALGLLSEASNASNDGNILVLTNQPGEDAAAVIRQLLYPLASVTVKYEGF